MPGPLASLSGSTLNAKMLLPQVLISDLSKGLLLHPTLLGECALASLEKLGNREAPDQSTV